MRILIRAFVSRLNIPYTRSLIRAFASRLSIFYAPNYGKVEGAYCFRLVRPSVRASVRPGICSDEPAHMRILIRAFASRLNILYTRSLIRAFASRLSIFYAPNYGKVEGAYCFRLVHPSVRASVTKFIKIQFKISYMDSSSKTN